jgi:hypothetical protein
MDFIAKCERYAELKRQLEDIEAEASPISAELRGLQQEIIAEHPTSGLGKSFKLASGGQLIFSENMTAKAVDKAAVAQWFIEHGMIEMLSVNHQTLTSFCKQEAEKMAPLPDGVEVGSFVRLSFRKS